MKNSGNLSRGRLIVATLLLVVATLACGGNGAPETRKLNLYPTETIVATQTPVVIVAEITTTPPATMTPIVIVATVTQNATTFCVDADVAVYLRPSPATTNYPIMPLPNGSIVADLGGRSGNWYFVRYEDMQGWVFSDYLMSVCH